MQRSRWSSSHPCLLAWGVWGGELILCAHGQGGGYAQHIYLHANKISSVWGNDREVLTTDGDESVGNFGAGRAQAWSDDGTNLTLDCFAKPGTGNTRGGAVVIIAGGAAGQIRRITGYYTGCATPRRAAPHNYPSHAGGLACSWLAD
jgi:hypothetical protein